MSVRTDKQGNFEIHVRADRPDRIAMLKTFLKGLVHVRHKYSGILAGP